MVDNINLTFIGRENHYIVALKQYRGKEYNEIINSNKSYSKKVVRFLK